MAIFFLVILCQQFSGTKGLIVFHGDETGTGKSQTISQHSEQVKGLYRKTVLLLAYQWPLKKCLAEVSIWGKGERESNNLVTSDYFMKLPSFNLGLFILLRNCSFSLVFLNPTSGETIVDKAVMKQGNVQVFAQKSSVSRKENSLEMSYVGTDISKGRKSRLW